MIYTLANDEVTAITPLGTHSGMDITIQNVNNDGYIYIDTKDTVSSTDYGYRLSPNSAISFELPGDNDLYVIASANDLDVAVLIVGLA
jgi:hypothetical protein